MVRISLFLGCFAALALTAPALAEQHIIGGGGIILKPLQPQPQASPPPPASPYPMNYSEEVAQSLQVRDGGLPLLPAPDRSASPYAPSVSFNGSMVRLKWRP